MQEYRPDHFEAYPVQNELVACEKHTFWYQPKTWPQDFCGTLFKEFFLLETKICFNQNRTWLGRFFHLNLFKMIRQITKLISLLFLFVSTSFFSYSQTTTVTFNEIPTTNSANSLNLSDTYDNSGVRFQIFSGSNSKRQKGTNPTSSLSWRTT